MARNQQDLGWSFWVTIIGSIVAMLSSYFYGNEKIMDKFSNINARLSVIEAKVNVCYITRDQSDVSFVIKESANVTN